VSESPYPPPQPHRPYPPATMSPSDERMWGMFGHLSAIAASLVTLPFLGPLIVFLVFKDRSGFVRGHSAEALNMTISLVLYEIALGIVCTIVSVVTLGLGAGVFALMAVPGIAALVFAVLAAVAANQGRVYRYPLILRLVR
jgi:uncharacterized protein